MKPHDVTPNQRASTRAHSARTALGVAGAALLLFTSVARADDQPGQPLPARAGDFTLKIETGVAIPLTKPQSDLYSIGGSQTVKALWALDRYFDVGPSATFIGLGSQHSNGNIGTAWALGGSVRFKRPHDSSFHGMFPWVDADALYVRTGGLNRAGLALAAGLSVPVGSARMFWVGPFVRYLQILQEPEHTGSDNRDAKLVIAGLSLDLGPGVRRRPMPLPAPEVRTVNTETQVCADRDGDGVLDKIDRCPDVAGSADNWGCPAYQKIVVKPDKLELKEKLQFAWNQAVLEPASFPVLDDVVQALKDNKGFRVQVEGHASSEGGDEHNQTLSEQRAQAVLDYLVTHGIGKERLVSKGFGSSVPIDTNATAPGRENNRRVEFVVNFIILNDGSK